MRYFSMAAPCTLKGDQTFRNSMRNLFSKQLIKCPRILSASARDSIGDFRSKLSAMKAIAKGLQLYLSVCFWTGKNLRMNSSTQFLCNAWTHFLFTTLSDVFKPSQTWILPLLQKVSSQCPEPAWSSWICSFFTAR